jgi:hypothetical protein
MAVTPDDDPGPRRDEEQNDDAQREIDAEMRLSRIARDRQADERAFRAEQRERRIDEREAAVDERHRWIDGRQDVADERDRAADRRERALEWREAEAVDREHQESDERERRDQQREIDAETLRTTSRLLQLAQEPPARDDEGAPPPA